MQRKITDLLVVKFNNLEAFGDADETAGELREFTGIQITDSSGSTEGPLLLCDIQAISWSILVPSVKPPATSVCQTSFQATSSLRISSVHASLDPCVRFSQGTLKDTYKQHKSRTEEVQHGSQLSPVHQVPNVCLQPSLLGMIDDDRVQMRFARCVAGTDVDLHLLTWQRVNPKKLFEGHLFDTSDNEITNRKYEKGNNLLSGDTLRNRY
ncbi:hypothetical protein Y1Q_0006297 [Alligator mississippiensis]|uniref:Uncharacterized protein n=1 Tax=Alligator mississippiensis TaxID=8496 RepID=A0A151NYJ3_ALLMI|nr:hypothetical protein Y1Q_0006297 [Alligator mississippiensis]